jgi:adenylate cyclase
MDTREFEAAGLYDPEAPDAAERLELLEWLAAHGVGVADLVEARAPGGLPALVGDVTLRPFPRLNLSQLATRAGIPPERIDAIRLAAGLPPVGPDEPAFSEDDAATFAAFAVGAAQFGDEAIRRFTRVMGASLAAVAEAAVSLFLVNVEAPIRAAGADELTLAQANVRAMQSIGAVPVAMRGLLRAHLETAIRRSRLTRRPEAIDTARLTVGFVDLVGFTALSRRMSTRELGDVIDRFEDTAHEVATVRDGRIVKLVGDEVMFVTVGAAAACDIALALVDQFAGDVSITPRGGLATGNLLVRSGDYYGPTVNLAARLADLAVPNELLVSAEVVTEAKAPGLRFEPAGKRLPKGFEEPVSVFAVERG